MNRLKQIIHTKPVLFVCWLLTAGSVFPNAGLNTRELISGTSAGKLLIRDTINIETGGTAPVEFNKAVSVFQQADFLSRVQDEYRQMQSDGKAPEFSIQQSAPHVWFYINQNQERTDITEVVNTLSGKDALNLVYYTVGHRFFGDYKAVIHVRLTHQNKETAYAVAVYAYPENSCCRFLVRHLPFIEKYFQAKTRDLTATAVQISTRLCNPERPKAIAKSGL